MLSGFQLTLKVEAWPESKTKLNDEFSLENIAALKWCLPGENKGAKAGSEASFHWQSSAMCQIHLLANW